MTAASRFISINGLTLHYLDFGDRGKPPLVCIHGLSGNAHNFDSLAPHLENDYHVISIDVRGRGDSQWGAADDYNHAVYTTDLAALIDQLQFATVTLIGTSMGGAIAMLYAGGYPERIERIVLNTALDPARPLLARMRHDRFGAGILHSVAAVWLPADCAGRYGADPDRPEAADNPGHEAGNDDEAQADTGGAAAWRNPCAEAAVQTSGHRPSGPTASDPTTGAA